MSEPEHLLGDDVEHRAILARSVDRRKLHVEGHPLSGEDVMWELASKPVEIECGCAVFMGVEVKMHAQQKFSNVRYQ